MSRARMLRVGDRVRFDGLIQTVVGLSGTLVRLVDERGRGSVVHLPYLLAADGFEQLGERVEVPLLPAGSLHGVPPEVIEEAQWWERHIIEVITGRPPDAQPSVLPRLGYDPTTRSLVQREQAKATELAAQGHAVSIRTLQRKRQRYEAQGLAGLIDWRVDRHRSLHGRADSRVVEALQQAIVEATDRSTRTVAYLQWRVEQILTAQHGAGVVAMPSRATFYRLFEKVKAGRHTIGSARTRRSLANRPAGPFGAVAALRPGELMQMDSTPLDVLVLLPGGVPGRVELTGMVDLATRSITAAVLRPTTKSVDASLLLARTVTPEPMRPGWAQALAMSRSVLPHRRLLELDQRLEHAAARPVIVPETIVCDRGNVFISHNFRAACASLGINFQPAHPHTPTDKPHIERTLESVSTLFCQFVSGYLGRSAEHRGRRVEDEPLWSLLELQELLDEWILAVWQHRAHDGLRDPVTPGRSYTPNERYATLVEAAGYVPVALSAQDYIELLPARWQAINSYGIKINHRVYDSAELNPWRRQSSGVVAKKNLWEVHHDPYDVSQIWVRNHHQGG
ncbi:Mu transposase C-terminal domain-containing protein [Dactylosporangium sp. AC04546]|uniref:Mu transposase C-terminal domain-containing protein n=1 Tax=Dactylosporangium sp. AC04546 TaxID=2862460 RepID=UPI001EDE1E39|nr:Mu transposase C-terminal domain-containing protein [Dactylosporangium sp. AC04546]WVK86727.1 Mu transposase C-terminal domain-containing protein [Dactylosporangium sp. AC04546]